MTISDPPTTSAPSIRRLLAWRRLARGLAATALMATVAVGADAPKTPSNTTGAFNPSELDTAISACTDFHQYVNRRWLSSNPIPAAYAAWGVWDLLAERNTEQLHDILERDARSKAPSGSNEQKVGDFYASCMDEKGIETAGVTPLQPELDRIDNIRSVPVLQQDIAHLHALGIEPLFSFDSEQDRKNSDEVIVVAAQGRLGLPDRDYYLADDAKSVAIRTAYHLYVATIFKLSGDGDEAAAGHADQVIALETRLASASMSRVQLRDPDTTYHRMTLEQASALAPAFAWAVYFKELGVPATAPINISTLDFFTKVGRELTAVPLDDWKKWLRFTLISTYSWDLSSKFVTASFGFYGTTLRGTREIRPRWKRCVDATDRNLGEALGQVYAKEAFPPAAKIGMTEMVNNLTIALSSDIKALDWMSDATKAQALAKLQGVARKVGYPDHWRNYASLSIDRTSFVENIQRAGAFETRHELGEIGKPLDRSEWGMTPPTVNSYYDPSMNEILFPAGMLQPPFFDPNRDDAWNYGSIGVIIGHELTHGFDDEGAKYDAKGNLADWWTKEDLAAFEKHADCIRQQFDEFAVGDVHENGKLVSGEGIADLGGLKIALAAYEQSLQGKERKVIDGLTPEQRFFIAYARSYAETKRSEAERLQATTDPHPLDRFRVNAPLSNMPEFASAFGCKSGDRMVRPKEKRCVVW